MRQLIILAIATISMTSCVTQRKTETISYSAVKCKCSYPDGFGMDRHKAECGDGTATVRSSDIVKRTGKTVKVESGYCTYIYIIR